MGVKGILKLVEDVRTAAEEPAIQQEIQRRQEEQRQKAAEAARQAEEQRRLVAEKQRQAEVIRQAEELQRIESERQRKAVERALEQQRIINEQRRLSERQTQDYNTIRKVKPNFGDTGFKPEEDWLPVEWLAEQKYGSKKSDYSKPTVYVDKEGERHYTPYSTPWRQGYKKEEPSVHADNPVANAPYVDIAGKHITKAEARELAKLPPDEQVKELFRLIGDKGSMLLPDNTVIKKSDYAKLTPYEQKIAMGYGLIALTEYQKKGYAAAVREYEKYSKASPLVKMAMLVNKGEIPVGSIYMGITPDGGIKYYTPTGELRKLSPEGWGKLQAAWGEAQSAAQSKNALNKVSIALNPDGTYDFDKLASFARTHGDYEKVFKKARFENADKLVSDIKEYNEAKIDIAEFLRRKSLDTSKPTPRQPLSAKEGPMKEAREEYIKKYGQQAYVGSVYSPVLSSVFPPARALRPDVELKDIAGLEWAEGVAMVALFAAPGVGGLAGAGLQAGAGGIFTYSTVKNWSNMTPTERGIAVAMDTLILGGAAGAFAKGAPRLKAAGSKAADVVKTEVKAVEISPVEAEIKSAQTQINEAIDKVSGARQPARTIIDIKVATQELPSKTIDNINSATENLNRASEAVMSGRINASVKADIRYSIDNLRSNINELGRSIGKGYENTITRLNNNLEKVNTLAEDIMSGKPKAELIRKFNQAKANLIDTIAELKAKIPETYERGIQELNNKLENINKAAEKIMSGDYPDAVRRRANIIKANVQDTIPKIKQEIVSSYNRAIDNLNNNLEYINRASEKLLSGDIPESVKRQIRIMKANITDAIPKIKAQLRYAYERSISELNDRLESINRTAEKVMSGEIKRGVQRNVNQLYARMSDFVHELPPRLRYQIRDAYNTGIIKLNDKLENINVLAERVMQSSPGKGIKTPINELRDAVKRFRAELELASREKPSRDALEGIKGVLDQVSKSTRLKNSQVLIQKIDDAIARYSKIEKHDPNIIKTLEELKTSISKKAPVKIPIASELEQTFKDINKALREKDIEALKSAGEKLEKQGNIIPKDKGGEIIAERGRLLQDKAAQILKITESRLKAKQVKDITQRLGNNLDFIKSPVEKEITKYKGAQAAMEYYRQRIAKTKAAINSFREGIYNDLFKTQKVNKDALARALEDTGYDPLTVRNILSDVETGKPGTVSFGKLKEAFEKILAEDTKNYIKLREQYTKYLPKGTEAEKLWGVKVAEGEKGQPRELKGGEGKGGPITKIERKVKVETKPKTKEVEPDIDKLKKAKEKVEAKRKAKTKEKTKTTTRTREGEQVTIRPAKSGSYVALVWEAGRIYAKEMKPEELPYGFISTASQGRTQSEIQSRFADLTRRMTVDEATKVISKEFPDSQYYPVPISAPVPQYKKESKKATATQKEVSLPATGVKQYPIPELKYQPPQPGRKPRPPGPKPIKEEEKKILRPPPFPIPAGSKSKEWTQKDIKSAIAWKDGVVVHAIRAPYRQGGIDSKSFSVSNLPQGLVVMRRFKGKGSQQLSARTTGAFPSKLTVDVGAVDAIITRAGGRRVNIRFTRGRGTTSQTTIKKGRNLSVKKGRIFHTRAAGGTILSRRGLRGY